MEYLIERAVGICFDGGTIDIVWNCLNHLYAQHGDPMVVHAAVLDGADKVVRGIFK